MFWKLFFIVFISAAVSLIDRIYLNNYATDFLSSLFSQYFDSATSPNFDKDIFSAEELREYNGVNKPELYLSIMGNVFDVTKGSQYYGPGKTYNYFVGRDASKGFLTGKLEDENNDNVANLKLDELRSLNKWLKFYRKEYPKVGKLIGKYYNKQGKLTPYGRQIKNLLKEAEDAKASEELEKQKFPPCNVEFDAERGTRVWCSNQSGGVERNWVGKPRQLWVQGSSSYRCACINEENEKLGNIKEYEGCNLNSSSCFISTDDN